MLVRGRIEQPEGGGCAQERGALREGKVEEEEDVGVGNLDDRRCGGWDDGGGGAGDGVGEAVVGGEGCQAGECRDVVLDAWIVTAGENEATRGASGGEELGEGLNSKTNILLGFKAVE